MNDMMKIVQALENYNILLKEVPEKIKNETKEQKEGFLGTLVDTLGSDLLRIYFQEKELLELVL